MGCYEILNRVIFRLVQICVRVSGATTVIIQVFVNKEEAPPLVVELRFDLCYYVDHRILALAVEAVKRALATPDLSKVRLVERQIVFAFKEQIQIKTCGTICVD